MSFRNRPGGLSMFETSLKPVLVLNKLFGLFISEDSKATLWIFPAFIGYLYCFYENRQNNLYKSDQLSIIGFLRDYAGAYSGLFAVILIYGHNFFRRKEIAWLISELSMLEGMFGGKVKKEKVVVKLRWFIGGVVCIWGSVFYANNSIRPGLNIYNFLGYWYPVFCHVCFGFFYSELLKFTRNIFIEINVRLTELRGGNCLESLERLLKAHFQLVIIAREQNQLFVVPVFVHLAHGLCVYVVLYGTIVKTFLEGTLSSRVGLIENLSYYKWCCLVFGSWWYVIRSWEQITEEVSHYIQNRKFS